MSSESNTEMKHTDRGFAYQEFEDFNGIKCSIQKSSIATDDCIWFGAKDIGLKHFKAYEGWKDVELVQTISEHHVANNRMHLSREQVAELLPVLQRFVETGEIDEPLQAEGRTPSKTANPGDVNEQ